MAGEVKVCSRVFMIEPNEGDPYVLVEIDIECPECGTITMRLLGHHLQTIRDVCISAMDQYPALTKIESRVVEHYELTGRANDPSTS
jgi:hypothetical protein